MAQKRDYSLTKDIDFNESKDFYALSDEYEAFLVPGRKAKGVLEYFLKIYEGACGEGAEIEEIFSVVREYAAMEVTSEDYVPSEEKALLNDMYFLIQDYEEKIADLNKQLDKQIEGWLAALNPMSMSPEQKRQDMQFVGQVELILNRRVFLHEMKDYINSLRMGVLPENYYPVELADPDSSFSSIDLPIMTHVPQETDITPDELSTSAIMQVLYNITAKDSYVIMKMFHDYDNGDACVRLWKNEGGRYIPQFFSVLKSSIYIDNVIYENRKTIWQGLIEDAAKQMGLGDDKQALAEAILGPEYKHYDKDYLFGPNIPPEVDSSEELNQLVHSYVKCTFNIYQTMLLTNSLVIKDDPAYVQLMFGIKELLYAFSSCLGLTLDNASAAVAVLKQLLSDYRKSVEENDQLSNPAVKQRLSICETLDDLLYLFENDCEYHNDPRGYFEMFLAKQIAASLLNSLQQDTSKEAVEAKAAEVMAGKAFKRVASKLPIHNLKHAPRKIVESILGTMK